MPKTCDDHSRQALMYEANFTRQGWEKENMEYKQSFSHTLHKDEGTEINNSGMK